MPFGTGPNDPWFYNRYFQIGPFTGTDQSNAAANAQRTRLLQGIGALPGVSIPQTSGSVPGSHTLQQTYGNPVVSALDSTALAPPPPVVAQPPVSQDQTMRAIAPDDIQTPQFLKDWGNDIMSVLGVPGYEAPAYPSSSSGTADAAPTESSPSPPPGPHVVHPPNPTVGAPVVAAPASPAAAAPDGVASDTMATVQKILQAIGYPSAPSTDNPKQAAADAYAAHEMDRTKLLAQLAFASGMTAGAGGSWEGIGRGFAAAGQTYDKGFDRYQKALDNSANRYADQQKEQYAYQAKKAGITADLYTAGEKQKMEQAKLVRDAAKDRQDILNNQLKLIYPKPGDNSVLDPGSDTQRQEAIIRSFQLGRPVIYHDLTK